MIQQNRQNLIERVKLLQDMKKDDSEDEKWDYLQAKPIGGSSYVYYFNFSDICFIRESV